MKLTRDFYERDTLVVARELLGKKLVYKREGDVYEAIIVETEAYLEKDDAAHFFKGLSPRTNVVEGSGGLVYVYLIYGVHYMFNIVTEPAGRLGCVLIRAVEPISGLDSMSLNRYGKSYSQLDRKSRINLSNGPGKLTKALNISKELYGKDLVNSDKLYIEDYRFYTEHEVARSKRIGIDYAKEGKDKFYRFFVKDDKYI